MNYLPQGEVETASGPAYIEYASANETKAEAPIDMFKVIKTGEMPAGISSPRSVAKTLLEVDSWLPFAAEAYQISPNIKDFVVVPCTIMFSDLPNANLAAFPLHELTAWNTGSGEIAYKTWARKPCFVEHKNDNPSIAAGLILDSSLRAMSNYIGGMGRVVLLSAWDRNRYPEIANKFLAGRSGQSMGCLVSDYSCSIDGISLRSGGCSHIHPKMGVRIPEVGNKLTYRIAHGITGFEVSSVAVPAWRNAFGRSIG